MVAPKLLAEDSANNFLQRSDSEQSSPTESPETTPTAVEAETMQSPFLRVSVSDAPMLPEKQPEPQSLPSPQPPRVPTRSQVSWPTYDALLALLTLGLHLGMLMHALPFALFILLHRSVSKSHRCTGIELVRMTADKQPWRQQSTHTSILC